MKTDVKVRMISNPIPPMTDPLGKQWKQPDPNKFQFFQGVFGGNKFVSISEIDLAILKTYEWSFPSGVYPGKMWRCGDRILWFEYEKGNTDNCVTRAAKIITGVGT